MNRILKNIKYNITTLDIIICMVLGLIYSILPEYYENGICNYKISIFFKALLHFIIFFSLAVLLRIIINKINEKRNKKLAVFEIFNKESKLYKYRLFILSGIILIFWLPMIIYLYPGTVANDTWGQLKIYKLSFLGDHHPVMTTIIMGHTLFFFNSIFNNWHISLFIYVIIQTLITSLVFSYSIIYFRKKLNIKNVFIFIFILVYALLPIFPGIVQNVSKDTIFAWIYVLFFINYLEIIRTNGNVLDKKRNLVMMIIISIFCCLTKKIGVYVLIISYLILIIFKINKRKIMYILTSIIFIMYILMPFLFSIFDVKKGGIQESYSLMFQQTARYIKYYPEDIKKDEKELIEKVIGKKLNVISDTYIEKYADPIKGFKQNTKKENYIKYLAVWFKQGIRHPNVYFDATNCMLSWWMSFEMYRPLMDMNNHSQLDLMIFKNDVSKRTWNNDLADTIKNMYDNLYQLPILKYLLTPGLYISLIPLFSLTTIIKNKKKRKYTLGLVPLFLLIISCFFSSTSGNGEGQRYLYAIIYTSIITISWTIYTMQKEK